VTPEWRRIAGATADRGDVDGGDLDEAVACYDRVLTINPRDARARTNIGTIRYRQGRTAEAIQSYRAALELDPNHGPARAYLDYLSSDKEPGGP